MNGFFCSVFTQEHLDDIPRREKQNPGVNLDELLLNKEQVKKKLKNISPAKSSGLDNINVVVLQELSKELREPLAYLLNTPRKQVTKDLERSKCHTSVQKGQKAETKQLPTCHINLYSLQDNGVPSL